MAAPGKSERYELPWPLAGTPPGGRLPAAVREGYQRARLITAVAELVHETGTEPNGEQLIAAAQMSRGTLYRLFGSKREAIEAACLEATHGLVEPVRAAAELEEPWLWRLAAGIGALLGASAEEAHLAELCLVHAPRLVGSRVPAGPAPVIEALAALMAEGRDAGRELAGAGYHEPSAKAELFAAAGVVYVMVRRLRDEEAQTASEARAEVVELAAQHFVGETEAAGFAAELRRG